MKIIVVLPALNEEKTINDVISRIPGFCDVFVVDDGSTDRTYSYIRRAGIERNKKGDGKVYVLRHLSPKGVGVCFKEGVDNALSLGADIIVSIDADGQMYPELINELINPIINKECDVVITNRFGLSNLKPEKMPFIKIIGNKIFSKLVSFLTGQNFSDTQCGFRAYNRQAAASLNLKGKFTYTQEVLLELCSKGFNILEKPIYVRSQRKYGKSKVLRSITKYIINVLKIIFNTLRSTRPSLFFGIPIVFFGLVGVTSGGFVVVNKYFFDGAIRDYPFLIVLCALFIIISVCFLILLFIILFIKDIKVVDEEILRRLKV